MDDKELLYKYSEIIRHIQKTCINNVERIDRLCETAVNTDVDLGMAYAYRRILDLIKESEV